MFLGLTSACPLDQESTQPKSNQSKSQNTTGDLDRRRSPIGVTSPAPKYSLWAGLNAHGDLRAALVGIGVFSCLANLLALTGPIFMLQIYDRVLPARSLPTLTAFLMLAIGLYAIFGFLDVIRCRLMARVAARTDASLSQSTFSALSRGVLRSRKDGDPSRPVQDLDQIRTFLASQGPIALFDLPWMPIFLAICFLLHPLIGWLTTGGMLVLIGLTVITDRRTRNLTRDAAVATAKRDRIGQSAHRGAESLKAMGMAQAVGRKWEELHGAQATLHREAGDVGATLTGASKAVRYALQSVALAAGAYLVIGEEISAGMIFAASIIVARTVAPIEQVIGNWKAMLAARQAWERLKRSFEKVPVERAKTALPAPEKRLSVRGLFTAPPGEHRATVLNVTFEIKAGTVLGVLGASASGKSSLARAIVGIWPAAKGRVCLDGASLDQWATTDLGSHIGYMPQVVDLFPGTIAENIARMDPEAPNAAVIAAARAAGVHDMIVALPGGYDFSVSDDGANLSAGQRQRIALARALYNDPFLVVLDEPNANLDTDGDKALVDAIAGVRGRGGICVVISHRNSIIPALDSVLIMENGMAKAFGPRDVILRALETNAPKSHRAAIAPALTVVEGEGA
jgi:ATP-binding cassette, subfamily C, type I secretion system permease/ATPase